MPMEMPAPTEAAMPTRKVAQVFWVANAAAKIGASVENRPVDEAREPRLHVLEHERAALFGRLLIADRLGQVLFFERVGEAHMLVFGGPRGRRGASGSTHLSPAPGPGYRSGGFRFRWLPPGTDALETQRPHHPDGLVLHEPPDILAPDERDVVAERRLEEVDQPAAVLVLLFRHLPENIGGSRKALGEAMGILAVDAPVLFFERDRERQDFALVEIGKLRMGPGPCAWTHYLEPF